MLDQAEARTSTSEAHGVESDAATSRRRSYEDAESGEDSYTVQEEFNVAFMTNLFDNLDEDGSGAIDRDNLDNLVKAIDGYMEYDSYIQVLSDNIRKLDAMGLKRGQYLEIVGAWWAGMEGYYATTTHGGTYTTTQSGHGGDTESIEIDVDFFIKMFKQYDTESVKTSVLKSKIEEYSDFNPLIQELANQVEAVNNSHIELDQFSILVKQWFAVVARTSQQVVEGSVFIDLKFLTNIFDELDEDETEMCPRSDLRKQIETYVQMDSRVQLLVDMIRNLGTMVVERGEYLELVEEWLAGCGEVGVSSSSSSSHQVVASSTQSVETQEHSSSDAVSAQKAAAEKEAAEKAAAAQKAAAEKEAAEKAAADEAPAFDRSEERAQARKAADERKRAEEAQEAKFKAREEKRKAKAKAKANKGRNY